MCLYKRVLVRIWTSQCVRKNLFSIFVKLEFCRDWRGKTAFVTGLPPKLRTVRHSETFGPAHQDKVCFWEVSEYRIKHFRIIQNIVNTIIQNSANQVGVSMHIYTYTDSFALSHTRTHTCTYTPYTRWDCHVYTYTHSFYLSHTRTHSCTHLHTLPHVRTPVSVLATTTISPFCIHMYMYISKYSRVHIHTCSYIHMYVHISIYIHIYVCIYMFLCIYICISICVYMCIYIHIFTHTYMYICAYIITHIYMYIYIYTYISSYTHKKQSYICRPRHFSFEWKTILKFFS